MGGKEPNWMKTGRVSGNCDMLTFHEAEGVFFILVLREEANATIGSRAFVSAWYHEAMIIQN